VVYYILGALTQMPVIGDAAEKFKQAIDKATKCNNAEIKKVYDEKLKEAEEKKENAIKEAKKTRTDLLSYLKKLPGAKDVEETSKGKTCKDLIKEFHADLKAKKERLDFYDKANEALERAVKNNEPMKDFISAATGSFNKWRWTKRYCLYTLLTDPAYGNGYTKDTLLTATWDDVAQKKFRKMTDDKVKVARELRIAKTYDEKVSKLSDCKDFTDKKDDEKTQVSLITKVWVAVKTVYYAADVCGFKDKISDAIVEGLKSTIIGKVVELVLNLLTGFLGTAARILYYAAKSVYYYYLASDEKEKDEQSYLYGQCAGAIVRILLVILGIGRRRKFFLKKSRKNRKH